MSWKHCFTVTAKITLKLTWTSTIAFLLYALLAAAELGHAPAAHWIMITSSLAMACVLQGLQRLHGVTLCTMQAVRGSAGAGDAVEDDNDCSVTLEDLVGQPEAELQSENMHPGKGWELEYNLRSRYPSTVSAAVMSWW